jgi:hypothetical protein
VLIKLVKMLFKLKELITHFKTYNKNWIHQNKLHLKLLLIKVIYQSQLLQINNNKYNKNKIANHHKRFKKIAKNKLKN